MKLALYTFRVFRKPAEDPANDGFHAINDPVFERVAEAPGFLGAASYEDQPGQWNAGEQVWPRFYEERGDGWSPATLSLWRDVAAVRDFSYSGLHAVALKRARDWFDAGPWPSHAAWWVASDHLPSWPEAVLRFEHIADHGPSARAFLLGEPFSPE